MASDPTVSVIISAYNRPQVVRYAIMSVLNSDFDDFELIIIGDGCNRETEESVRSFTDPRISFYNLPANTGSQSEPHNEGVRRARGKYILFLNQDDMYFPDHISRSVSRPVQKGVRNCVCQRWWTASGVLNPGDPHHLGQSNYPIDDVLACFPVCPDRT